MSSGYITFEDVEVKYTPIVYGLRGVSLSIERGDFVFFVGKTGAGKSTLIKLLTREVRHTGGKVLLHGQDLGQVRDRDVPSLRRQMGIVPQDFALLPRKKVWENVAYAMRAVGHTRREVRKKVPEILERVSIAHRADAFPNELSGGEQQRVAIARALINNPSLLVADEPTGNLDPELSWEIMEILRSLNNKGTTVLVASHDMMVIHRMARRIVTLEQGQIVSDTATDSIPEFEPAPTSLYDSLLSAPAVVAVPDLPVEPEAEVVAQEVIREIESDPALTEEPEPETRPADPVEVAEDLEPAPTEEPVAEQPEPEPSPKAPDERLLSWFYREQPATPKPTPEEDGSPDLTEYRQQSLPLGNEETKDGA